MIDIKKARKIFESKLKGIADSAEIDWIFCEVTKKSRSEVKTLKQLKILQYLRAKIIVNKRAKGMPLDKIIKRTNFYGFDFYVNKDVLIPRFETEILVEYILKNASGSGLDVGTGSGAIAIILALLGNNKMTAIDISKNALKVANRNAKKLKVDINFIQSDLFDKVKGKFDFIVSNPPYIKSNDINTLQPEVKNFEPKIALDGGDDGLSFYRQIIKDAPKYLKSGGKIFFEIGMGQRDDITNLLLDKFEDIKIIKDMSKIDRIITATKR